MWFLFLGVALLAMKYLAVAPVVDWPWFVVLSPFVLAMAWWSWADWSGYTKRQVAKREAQRRAERLEKQRAQLGLPTDTKRRPGRKP